LRLPSKKSKANFFNPQQIRAVSAKLPKMPFISIRAAQRELRHFLKNLFLIFENHDIFCAENAPFGFRERKTEDQRRQCQRWGGGCRTIPAVRRPTGAIGPHQSSYSGGSAAGWWLARSRVSGAMVRTNQAQIIATAGQWLAVQGQPPARTSVGTALGSVICDGTFGSPFPCRIYLEDILINLRFREQSKGAT
jgi:hypothetical protein